MIANNFAILLKRLYSLNWFESHGPSKRPYNYTEKLSTNLKKKLMLRRYKTQEAKESAEYIYKLRKRGYTHKEIADQVGKNLQTAMQAYKRECAFREKAFYYPFIEYISVRTENAIRKSMADEMFLDPEKLTDLQAIRTLLCWPGVNDGVLKDLAEGLEEAGYESFDPEEMMEKVFSRDKRYGPLRQ